MKTWVGVYFLAQQRFFFEKTQSQATNGPYFLGRRRKGGGKPILTHSCKKKTKQKDLCETVNCPVADQCNLAGVCDQNTGNCTVQALQDNMSCDDADEGTEDDVCIAGVCRGTGFFFFYLFIF